MLSELIPEEKRKLHEIEQQVLQLENENKFSNPTDIYMNLSELEKRLNELDKLVSKESKLRKDDYRRRVSHLRTTYNHIRKSLDNLIRRKNHISFDSNKQALFNGATESSNHHDIEMNIAENESLQNSSKMLHEYLNVGKDTLSNLYSQKEKLKGIQRKAFDILNSLGIANTLMKLVEKRDFYDKWIVYIGMVLILCLIFIIWS